jgi:hypothetical protein
MRVSVLALGCTVTGTFAANTSLAVWIEPSPGEDGTEGLLSHYSRAGQRLEAFSPDTVGLIHLAVVALQLT